MRARERASNRGTDDGSSSRRKGGRKAKKGRGRSPARALSLAASFSRCCRCAASLRHQLPPSACSAPPPPPDLLRAMASSTVRGLDKELLECFWPLASLNAAERLQAAERLLTYLQAKQAGVADTAGAGPELLYSLKRLVRGLSSSRDGARQGFALALTNVRSSSSSSSAAAAVSRGLQRLLTSPPLAPMQVLRSFPTAVSLSSIARMVSDFLSLQGKKGQVRSDLRTILARKDRS